MQLRLQAEHRRSRALQDEIVRQERLASLGRLVAGVAHEISTPLGVAVTAGSLIGEAVDALVRQIESPRPMKSELLKTLAATREGLAILTTNLGRASELMGQFKLVAVDQSSNVMRRVNVGEYVEEVLGSLQPLLRRRKVQVAIECAAPVQTVTVPGALSQVVTNLLQNALTHAFGPEEAGTVTFSVEREDEFTVLACRDNGRGMEQAVANRIFEPFFTTRIGSGGSGLGLFLVNNLVTEALKGDIAVFSMPGQGTTFRVRFRDLAATSTTLDGTRPPSGEVERSGTR
jgi:signal transduction histidine kinase